MMLHRLALRVGFVLMIATSGPALAQSSVAIVRNFASLEIDRIQILLTDMGHMSQVFDQEGLTYGDVSGFDLVIWDDLSFQVGGLTDNDVLIFESAFNAGIPLYLLGDDLAFSHVNLSAGVSGIWTGLLHLNDGTNFGGNGTLTVVDSIHPVINGPFGLITDFALGIDPDATNATGTGEIVLGVSGAHDVLLAFEDSVTGVRSVTQNCLLTDGAATDQTLRNNLLKNAVAWLLESGVPCPADCAGGTPDDSVNVTDLLALLANWGGTPVLCDITPPGGDGAVNVTDLLALLAAWGACS